MVGDRVLELGVAAVEVGVLLVGAPLAVGVVFGLAAARGHLEVIVLEVRVVAVLPFGVRVHAATRVLVKAVQIDILA